ncbi:MAG: hypothetical protein HUK25_03735, partial [Treponema sp.]|nr:hypothetical protein [Treponema sp.]
MKKKRNTKSTSKLITVLISIFCVIGMGVSLTLFINDFYKSETREDEEPIGVVLRKTRSVSRKFSDGSTWYALNEASPIYSGDWIRTGGSSELDLTWIIGDPVTGQTIPIPEDTTFLVLLGDDNNLLMDLKSGTLSVSDERISVKAGNVEYKAGKNSSMVVSAAKDGTSILIATSGDVTASEARIIPEKKRGLSKVASKVVSGIKGENSANKKSEQPAKKIVAGQVVEFSGKEKIEDVEPVTITEALKNESTAETLKKVTSQKKKTKEEQKKWEESVRKVYGEEKAEEIINKQKNTNGENPVIYNMPEEVKLLAAKNEERILEEKKKEKLAEDAEARKAEKEKVEKIEKERIAKEKKAEDERIEKLRQEKAAAQKKADAVRLEKEKQKKLEAQKKAEEAEKARVAEEKKKAEEVEKARVAE